MKSSYLCLIGCVAALNFSVYSANMKAVTTFDGFRGEVNRIVADSKAANHKNAFEEAVDKVEKHISAQTLVGFDKLSAQDIVEWVISHRQDKSLQLVPSKGRDGHGYAKVLQVIGVDGTKVGELGASYYEHFVKETFNGELLALPKGKTFTPIAKIDYKKVMKDAAEGNLKHLTPLWSIYNNKKDSASPFEKIVASVSAFLAGVCESNDNTVELAKITNGLDVYKCLMNLGFDQIDNPNATDKGTMSLAKLMGSLPAFMADLDDKGLLAKVVKGGKEVKKEEKGEEEIKHKPGERRRQTYQFGGGNGGQHDTTKPEGKKPLTTVTGRKRIHK